MELQPNSIAEELLSFGPAAASGGTAKSRPTAVLVLDSQASTRLRDFAVELPLPLEDLLLTGYAALLFRLTGQDLVTVSSIRSRGSSKATVFDFSEQANIRDVVASRKRFPPGADRRNSFFFGEPTGTLPGAAMDADLALQVSSRNEGFTLTLSSAAGTIPSGPGPAGPGPESTLQSWLLYLRQILSAAVANPSTPVSQLEMLDEIALHGIYARLNDTSVSHARNHLVHHRFAERAASSPESIAVICGSRRLTYGELDRQSDQLAARLTEIGAGPDRSVAICLERSVALPVALLAVLKSGSCYVPLDPQHPPERIAGILMDCCPIAAISETRVAHLVSGAGVAVLSLDSPIDSPIDENASPQREEARPRAVAITVPEATADHVAYIIFTSGTTGKPKGAAISHGGLANLLEALATTPGLNAADRQLALATVSFDMAVIDIFVPLTVGATVVIAEQSATADPYAIAQLIREHGITTMMATPTTWKMLIQSGWKGKRGLKALTGGEALPRDLANSLIAIVGELWNCYGPTETSVCSAVLQLHAGSGIVPIGGPIANTSFYVMDPAGRPVPAGVPGELYVGGEGVGRGYLLRPELTEQRFVPDRFSRTQVASQGGARLFRTGDLVRLLEERSPEDGTLEFLGRLDHQVKLRGFRIELGEIESVLRSHPAVADAVVLLRKDTGCEPRLVAYLTSRGTSSERSPEVARLDPAGPDSAGLNVTKLREHCARLLPAYMLPSAFARLDRIPLTPSGKVDRNALPAPESLEAEQSFAPAPLGETPRGPVEARLLAIFRDVLNRKAIGVTDSFFHYGGYSLLSIELFNRINKALNLSLPISLLFDAPTVRGLAQLISSGIPPPSIVPIRPGGTGTPVFIIHSYLLYAALPQIVDPASAIYGIRESAGDRALHSVEKRAALYVQEILKTTPAGPVHLVGWCAAASLTVEVARQLQAGGHRVEMVALLDAERPGFDLRPAGPAVLLRDRLRTFLNFHRKRLHQLPSAEKTAYISAAIQRYLDAGMEAFFIRHVHLMLWLERHFRSLLPAFVFENSWANTAALQDYSSQPYPGRLTLFLAGDVPRYAMKDETLGWGEVAVEGVDVVLVPGDHESMFRKPLLSAFGLKLREAMTGDRLRAPVV